MSFSLFSCGWAVEDRHCVLLLAVKRPGIVVLLLLLMTMMYGSRIVKCRRQSTEPRTRTFSALCMANVEKTRVRLTSNTISFREGCEMAGMSIASSGYADRRLLSRRLSNANYQLSTKEEHTIPTKPIPSIQNPQRRPDTRHPPTSKRQALPKSPYRVRPPS